MKSAKDNRFLKFAGSILLCFFAAFIGEFFTSSSVDTWYAALEKPFFNPPSWLFGLVWPVLYMMMGYAIFLIWKRGLNDKFSRFTFWFFWLHLAVNALWSVSFFGLQNILLGLINIIVLLVMIVILYRRFAKIDKQAAGLLVLYLIWASFATILNFSLLILN